MELVKSGKDNDEILLSVIVPYFNEKTVLPILHARLVKVLNELPESCEIVYIDDGSTDKSHEVIDGFSDEITCTRSIVLSRNFGKEAAMSAGLKYCRGQTVILLDADLQDPPELIPDMIAKWREGYDVVNMQRSERLGETRMKRASAALFYRLLNSLVKNNIPENVGDFRLLSRRVVEHINELPERNRYMKGLFMWPGFEHATIQYQRDSRCAGETKWNYFKLLGLAVDGITSFSIRPLRLATFFGSIVALGALIFGGFIVVKTMVFGETVSGYPTIMVVQLALGGIQLLSIGLLGEYIGRIFIESKARPVYVVKSLQDRQRKQDGAAPAETPVDAVVK
ncbi:glycosyltransferase family 2 protein [Vibrio tapetis subsp. quintayensis]|uniref:glycosyltransferase family 2 protein n=1 Tax=Vibrio tapetis TaxID=52443 RepID=UPI0025B4BBEB|nr:glycosyltransferase family 2 protein [Vibrio tapetis]MDN3682000.1 glycosyltransferase family 2 protein [Vibrio tapetis subsp. quintayensis]